MERNPGVPSIGVDNMIAGDAPGFSVQAGIVEGGLHLHCSTRSAVPRQLPAGTRHFTGRDAELRALTRLLGQADGARGTLVISAIQGTAGIGKTALAVRWAHQAASHFPDGQLYVNLRGFDPAGSAMSRAEAIRGFLDAFEVPPERIPVGLDAQVGLYRSLTAGRRVLVVLDNARDADQVRPLLPGGATCLVVVTSRNRLTGLVAAQGARPLTLDLLGDDDARALLLEHIDSERADAEPEALTEIITLCAGLPLALSIAAARAVIHPEFPLTVPAEELRNAHTDLEVFGTGDGSVDVRAVFDWSYRRLRPDAARLFRLLGIHSGPDITTAAAASLAGVPMKSARRLVSELDRTHLLQELSPGRFAFHDLLRAYARQRSTTLDTGPQRHAATGRMLDHYLHTAHAAARLLHPRRLPVALAVHREGVTPERFADLPAALAWFDHEHAVLMAAIQVAAAEHPTHTWQLAWTLGEFFERRGHWHDNATTNESALSSTLKHGDRLGRAHAHRGLGRAYPWLGRYDEAREHFESAIDLFTEIGDPHGLGHTHVELSWLFEHQDLCTESIRNSTRALALFDALGDRTGRAAALCRTAFDHTALGNHHDAFAHCQEALGLCRELGNRRSESHALSILGVIHYNTGHYRESITHYLQAIALHHQLDDRYHEANVLNRLAEAHLANGDPGAARRAWQRALPILEHLGHALGSSVGYPDATQIRARLRQLDRTAR